MKGKEGAGGGMGWPLAIVAATQ